MNLMTRRRALMAQAAGSILPSAYQQVEYIQSSGTQRLVLSDAMNPASNILTYKITVDAQVHTSNPSTGIITGCGSGAGRWLGVVNSGNSVGLGGSIYFSDIDISQKHRYVLDYTVVSPTDATCDGTGTINRTISHQSSGKISLFAGVEGTGVSNYPVKARIYYAKIENSGVIARELYPCYRKADNVIGMYDAVSGTFFTNAGSGSFTKGADVN